MKALVVEDNIVDATKCVSLLKKLGATEIDAVGTVAAAHLRLDDVIDGKLAPPDVIILDLSFSFESGFEVLRRWKAHEKTQRHSSYRVDTDGGDGAKIMRLLRRQQRGSQVGRRQRAKAGHRSSRS